MCPVLQLALPMNVTINGSLFSWITCKIGTFLCITTYSAVAVCTQFVSPDNSNIDRQSIGFCPIPICSPDPWPLWMWPEMSALWRVQPPVLHRRMSHGSTVCRLDRWPQYTELHLSWKWTNYSSDNVDGQSSRLCQFILSLANTQHTFVTGRENTF